MQTDGAGLRHLFPLVKILVLAVENFVGDVGVYLPTVRGMGFLNVDHEELNLVLVLAVQALHVLNLSTEGRSSVTAKDKRDWLLAFETGQPDPFF